MRGKSKITEKKTATDNAKTKRHKLYLLRARGVTVEAELRRKMLSEFNIVVSRKFVRCHNTDEKFDDWMQGNGIKVCKGAGRRSSITPEVQESIEGVIEDDNLTIGDIPKVVEKETKVKVSKRTVQRHFKRSARNPDGYWAHITPLETPLSGEDAQKRVNYAENGPILDGANSIGPLGLAKAWKNRRRQIAYWDHKPFYLGKFHRHNWRQRRMKHSKKPLKKGRKEKFSPKFMVFGLMTYSGCFNYFHCVRKRNKRRSRGKNGALIKKYTFVHEAVNQHEVNLGAKSFIGHLKERGIKLVIGDCDSKLHAKSLVKLMNKHGIAVYGASGKKCGNELNGYPPRSHDCNPCESWFTQWNQKAGDMLKGKKRKTMKMWKLALERSCNEFPKANLRKLIDTQRKVMKEIKKKNGGRTKY